MSIRLTSLAVVTIATSRAVPLTDLAICCSPGTGTVMDLPSAARLATVLKALAEPTRLRLVSIIAAGSAGATCVCDLTGPVGLSQPTVSHHLKILVDAGILHRAQHGKWAYYSVVAGALESVATAIAPT